jgi:galactonate dehydratase
MKIASITTYTVPPRWLFLRMETDDGTVGWGEPVVEGRAATVAAAVDELSDYLLGRDPRAIEDIWTVLYRGGFYRGGPIHMSALAGIDQALWDIKGKHYGAPVFDLLGGAVRDRIKVYSWIGGDRPSETATAARAAVARGFGAVKMNGTSEMQFIDSWEKVDLCVQSVATVRDAVGPHIGVGVDFHGRVHKPMAKVLIKELEPYKLMFIEEPVLSEHVDAVLDVLRNAATPIALGERLYSRWDFKHIVASGAVDIVQPDPSHAGGITETRKIATMAEAYDVALALHCPPRPDRPRRLPTDRRGDVQRVHPGAEPGHPLQHRQRSPGLPGRPVRLRLRRGHGHHPGRPRPGHRGQRGVRARAGPGGTSLAQPGLAPRRRLLRRMVKRSAHRCSSFRSLTDLPGLGLK